MDKRRHFRGILVQHVPTCVHAAHCSHTVFNESWIIFRIGRHRRKFPNQLQPQKAKFRSQNSCSQEPQSVSAAGLNMLNLNPEESYPYIHSFVPHLVHWPAPSINSGCNRPCNSHTFRDFFSLSSICLQSLSPSTTRK